MIRINLLPHREQARKQRRQQFFMLLALTSLGAGLVWLLVHSYNESRIDAQVAKNDFIKREIAKLDEDIAEIKRLKEQTQALLQRKQVIESLQGNRAETVHMFNELASQMPEGVFLRTVKQTGGRLNLLGIAQSNARVSQLMRNLDASPSFEKPQLVEIKAVDFNRRRVSEFNLNISIERAPAPEGEQDKRKPAAAAKKEAKRS